MTTAQRSFAAALLVCGVLLGAASGILVAVAQTAPVLSTVLLGAGLFLVPAVLAAVLWTRAGLFGRPLRTPFRDGDRFQGWRVERHLGRVGSLEEYEVSRGPRRAYLTTADHGWSPTANDRLLTIDRRHLARPVAAGPGYLIVDRADGRPLTEQLAESDVYAVAVSVLAALEDVHLQGVAHGGVHPSNVLIGDRGVLLGAFDRSRTAKPMNPLDNWDALRRNDIAGWADVLYAMATGHVVQGAFAEPVTAAELTGFPEWLRPVVGQALATSLAPSTSDINRALAAAARAHGLGTPVAGSPQPQAPPPSSPSPKRAALVGVTTAAAALLLLILAPTPAHETSREAQPPPTTTPEPPTTTPTTTEPPTTTSTTPPTTTSSTTTTTSTNQPVPEPHWQMPNLVGTNLQAAQDKIQSLTADELFFTSSHDATGAGRHQVLDDNWTVCTQNIPPGQPITPTSKIDFGAVKTTETCP